MTAFFLDTSALFSKRFVESMSPRCRRNGHRLFASALVLAERVFQLRRKLGEQFDSDNYDSFLLTHRIEVVAFDQAAAHRVAASLGSELRSDDEWQLAKWLRCAKAVGHRGEPPGKPRCPATVDWFIARHIAGPDTVLVTEDKGAEFASIRCVSIEEALRMVSIEAGLE